MTVDHEVWIEPCLRDVLSDVYDPCCREKGISVVDMGLLHRAEVDGGAAHVELMLTSGCARSRPPCSRTSRPLCAPLPDVDTATVELVWHEAWSPARLSDSARAKLRFLPDPATVPTPRRTSPRTGRGALDPTTKEQP